MRLNVSMDDVVVMAVLQGQEDLSNVMRTYGLGVDEARRRPLDDLEAEVRPCHELEHHVEHSLRAARSDMFEPARSCSDMLVLYL